jgi:hypothetical protein
MSEEKSETQPDAQAGKPGEAEGVGAAVGVLHSSEETLVMRVERRRGTCPHVSSGNWPKAPQGDKPEGRKVTNADSLSEAARPRMKRTRKAGYGKSVRPV